MISDTIESLGAGDYNVTRANAATYDANGRAVGASTSTVAIRAHVQTSRGRELLMLPEGLRTREARTVWTVTQLFAGDQGHAPDLIAVGAETFEVQKVEAWPGFYKAIAVKDPTRVA